MGRLLQWLPRGRGWRGYRSSEGGRIGKIGGKERRGREGGEKTDCAGKSLQLSHDVPLCSHWLRVARVTGQCQCVRCQQKPTKDFGPPYHWERAVCVCVITGGWPYSLCSHIGHILHTFNTILT